MTAFNVVRFRVKPGRADEFVAAHRLADTKGFVGSRRFVLVDTGDNTYCAVGEWDSFDNIVAARPTMIGMLDGFRHLLEELGPNGVTDPVSGKAVVEMGPPAVKRRAKPKAKKKAPAKKAAKKSAKKAVKKAVKKKAKRGRR
jgi:hypothetical protein